MTHEDHLEVAAGLARAKLEVAAVKARRKLQRQSWVTLTSMIVAVVLLLAYAIDKLLRILS